MIILQLTPIILSLTFLLYTEYIADCSVYTCNKMMTSLLIISLCPFLAYKYSKKLQNFITIIISINVLLILFYLWFHRIKVHKFITLNDYEDLLSYNNDIVLCYKLSSLTNINKVNINDKFVKFIKFTEEQVKNRKNNECLIVNFDFSDINLSIKKNMIEFNKLIDVIHFSKFGKNILFFFKIGFLEISSLSNFNLIKNPNRKIDEKKKNILQYSSNKYNQLNTNKQYKCLEILDEQNNSINEYDSKSKKLSSYIPAPPPVPIEQKREINNIIKKKIDLKQDFSTELQNKLKFYLENGNLNSSKKTKNIYNKTENDSSCVKTDNLLKLEPMKKQIDSEKIDENINNLQFKKELLKKQKKENFDTLSLNKDNKNMIAEKNENKLSTQQSNSYNITQMMLRSLNEQNINYNEEIEKNDARQENDTEWNNEIENTDFISKKIKNSYKDNNFFYTSLKKPNTSEILDESEKKNIFIDNNNNTLLNAEIKKKNKEISQAIKTAVQRRRPAFESDISSETEN